VIQKWVRTIKTASLVPLLVYNTKCDKESNRLDIVQVAKHTQLDIHNYYLDIRSTGRENTSMAVVFEY